MSRRLHILMPMGGLGSRFAMQGWALPKPLIPVDGMPMFQKAISSFDGIKTPAAVTAIIRREMDDEFKLADHIKQARPDTSVIVIPAITKGAVETCLAAAELIKPDDGIVLLDCDLWFSSPAYLSAMADVLAGKHKLDGMLLVFKSNSPRYSFAMLEGKRVTRTAEKEVISPYAIAGAYFFASGADFLKYARDMVSRPPPVNEYYASLLFNTMIARGGVVEAAIAEHYASYGTPEELALYQSSHASATVS